MSELLGPCRGCERLIFEPEYVTVHGPYADLVYCPRCVNSALGITLSDGLTFTGAVDLKINPKYGFERNPFRHGCYVTANEVSRNQFGHPKESEASYLKRCGARYLDLKTATGMVRATLPYREREFTAAEGRDIIHGMRRIEHEIQPTEWARELTVSECRVLAEIGSCRKFGKLGCPTCAAQIGALKKELPSEQTVTTFDPKMLATSGMQKSLAWSVSAAGVVEFNRAPTQAELESFNWQTLQSSPFNYTMFHGIDLYVTPPPNVSMGIIGHGSCSCGCGCDCGACKARTTHIHWCRLKQ